MIIFSFDLLDDKNYFKDKTALTIDPSFQDKGKGMQCVTFVESAFIMPKKAMTVT